MSNKKTVRVVYTYKSRRGYISEQTQNFSTLKEAIQFVRYMQQSGGFINKPVIEIA
jgi:hypothetical protein